MKNFVLLTSILILTYGIYVPKSWRRAAIVSAMLAVVPFITIMAVCLWYPAEMHWVFERRDQRVVPLRLFGVDAVFLLIPGRHLGVSGLERSHGCGSRWSRRGSLASTGSAGGSAPAGWATSISPSISYSSDHAPSS